MSVNTITRVEPSEVASSKTVDKGRHRPRVAPTDSNLLVSRLEVNRGRYEEGPTNYKHQASSSKLRRCCTCTDKNAYA